MWWNIAIGGSMLASSISSLVGTVANLVSRSSGTQSEDYSYGSNFVNQDHTFFRISKYPSKSTIGYGMY